MEIRQDRIYNLGVEASPWFSIQHKTIWNKRRSLWWKNGVSWNEEGKLFTLFKKDEQRLDREPAFKTSGHSY